jgi:ribonuclease HII
LLAPTEPATNEPPSAFEVDPSSFVLGIDEAGRGSWVGPLVAGGFLIRADRLAELGSLGLRDSKLLSRSRREALYRELGSVGQRVSVALGPGRIDRYVNRGRLNHLEARAFARLIRRTRPSRVFLDACDPVAHRFGRLVARLSRCDARVVARHRADREIPVVSAASIVAKVRRDRAIARLRALVGETLGSGYPSDPKTLAFVREWLGRHGVEPPWLRRSWLTTERVKLERTVVPLERFLP